MKKKAVIIIIIAVVILILAGAGVFYFMHKKNVEDNSFVATQTAICIKKDGTVVEAGIEEFDSTIYDQLELDTFIRGEVADYNTTVGAEKIKVQQITVENNVATMYLEYSSPQDYAAFHGETFFVGTMQEAIEAGYMENIGFYACNNTCFISFCYLFYKREIAFGYSGSLFFGNACRCRSAHPRGSSFGFFEYCDNNDDRAICRWRCNFPDRPRKDDKF